MSGLDLRRQKAASSSTGPILLSKVAAVDSCRPTFGYARGRTAGQHPSAARGAVSCSVTVAWIPALWGKPELRQALGLRRVARPLVLSTQLHADLHGSESHKLCSCFGLGAMRPKPPSSESWNQGAWAAISFGSVRGAMEAPKPLARLLSLLVSTWSLSALPPNPSRPAAGKREGLKSCTDNLLKPDVGLEWTDSSCENIWGGFPKYDNYDLVYQNFQHGELTGLGFSRHHMASASCIVCRHTPDTRLARTQETCWRASRRDFALSNLDPQNFARLGQPASKTRKKKGEKRKKKKEQPLQQPLQQPLNTWASRRGWAAHCWWSSCEGSCPRRAAASWTASAWRP